MSADLPLVSVGVPTHNRSTLLPRAIQSVLKQDYPNLEVIISDNASTDGTPQVCAGYQRRDPRIRYIRQPHNVGAARNFAAALDSAVGDYFMWLGDDDWIDSTYIAQCLEALRNDPSVVLAAGVARYYEHGVVKRERSPLPLQDGDRFRRVIEYYRNVGSNGQFYGLIRTGALRQTKFHNLIGGDWYVLAGLAFQGRMASVNTVCIHREAGGPMRNYSSWVRSTDSARVLAHSRALAYMGIAYYAWMDILRGSPVYQELSFLERYWLATRVFYVVVKRHVLSRATRRLKVTPD